MGALAPGPDVAATSRAWYDELRLPGAVAAGLRDIGYDEADAWAVTDLVRVSGLAPAVGASRAGEDRRCAPHRGLAGS